MAQGAVRPTPPVEADRIHLREGGPRTDVADRDADGGRASATFCVPVHAHLAGRPADLEVRFAGDLRITPHDIRFHAVAPVSGRTVSASSAPDTASDSGLPPLPPVAVVHVGPLVAVRLPRQERLWDVRGALLVLRGAPGLGHDGSALVQLTVCQWPAVQAALRSNGYRLVHIRHR